MMADLNWLAQLELSHAQATFAVFFHATADGNGSTGILGSMVRERLPHKMVTDVVVATKAAVDFGYAGNHLAATCPVSMHLFAE